MVEYAGSTDPITMLHMALQRMDEKSEKTNEMLFAKLDKTNEKVDKLSEIVSQQAILFEKFATMEANHKDSVNRLHARIDKQETEMLKKVDAIEKHSKVLEGYMTHDGCPVHKSFLASREHQIKKWHETADSITKRVTKMETKVGEIENAPVKIAKTIANRIIMVFGTALGGWLLYKFGFTLEAK